MSIYSGNMDYDILYISDNRYNGFNATMTYLLDVERYYIPPVGVDNEILKVDWYICDRIYSYEYPQKEVVEGVESGEETGLCIIPATITINVASQLGVSASVASGKTVIFDGVSHLIDSAGNIEITINDNAQYTIDTSVVRKGSEIYVDTTEASTSEQEYAEAIPKPIFITS
jgi:hypothetical protein